MDTVEHNFVLSSLQYLTILEFAIRKSAIINGEMLMKSAFQEGKYESRVINWTLVANYG